MKVLELFAGTRSIGKAFEARGHEVFSVEWDKDFENIDLYADILTVTAKDILEKFGRPDVIWASPDCTTYSVAAISKHRKKELNGNLTPQTEYAEFCDKVNTHVVELIKELNPRFYFIENPVGGLRKMDFMQELPRHTVTYCQYGERRQKPTDIWTNHPDPKFKPPCKRGAPCHDAAPRGAKTGTQALKNAVEKAKIPVMLCEHIVDICEGDTAKRYVASISYGKDSLAQLEVIHQHGLPLTDIVTADIMATPEIPAYLPELVEFRERLDKEIEARYGIPVTHVKADKSFVELFYRELTERSKYTGIYGWPPVFGHWCMKWLKQEPIQKYFDGLDCVEWVGIAADEPARHGQLNERKRSALVEYGITEAEAMEICEGLGWVSPTYLHSGRDGCWFCPCQGIDQLRRLYNEFPEYWQMMMDWDKDKEKRFKIDNTLEDYDCRFRLEKSGAVPVGRKFRWSMLEEYGDQLSLFD